MIPRYRRIQRHARRKISKKYSADNPYIRVNSKENSKENSCWKWLRNTLKI